MTTVGKLGVAGVCLASGVGGFFIWRSMSDPLAAKIAEARAIGLPVAPDDLKSPPIPNVQNGAEAVDEVVADMEASAEAKADMKQLTAAMSSSGTDLQRKQAVAILVKLRPQLKLIAAATAKPHCQFPFNWSDVAHVRFLEAVWLKHFVRAFCLQAETQCAEGNTSGALQSLLNAHRTGRLLCENPLLISTLVQVACEAIVEKSLDRMIAMRRRDLAFLKAAQEMHRQFGPLPDYRQAIRTEVVYTMAIIDQAKCFKDMGVKTETPDDNTAASEPIAPSDKAALKADLLALYLDVYKALPKSDANWDSVHTAVYTTSRKKPPEDAKLSKMGKEVVAQFQPTLWNSVVDVVIRCEERRRLTDTSLALFIGKAQHGRFAKDVASLGASAMDPFSGKPFVFRPAGRGFTLYGVGLNRADDGGDPKMDDVASFD